MVGAERDGFGVSEDGVAVGGVADKAGTAKSDVEQVGGGPRDADGPSSDTGLEVHESGCREKECGGFRIGGGEAVGIRQRAQNGVPALVRAGIRPPFVGGCEKEVITTVIEQKGAIGDALSGRETGPGDVPSLV